MLTDSVPADSIVVPERIALQAGPLSLCFENGDLRYIRYGKQELIRRIYGAVRDHQWGTVPAVLSNLEINDSSAGFALRYTSTHRQNDLHFVWQAQITGDAHGRIRFVFEGEAKSTFRRNRIGLCVLHPANLAGLPVRLTHAGGASAEVQFPGLVEPAPTIPGFGNLIALSYEVAPGVRVELEFSGDLFEMEDQRNWGDASYKTFSTPLRLPFPVEVKAGTRVRQEVRVQWVGSGMSTASVSDVEAPVQITVGTKRHRLPALGLSVASHGEPLKPQELERLSELWLWHLRVDLALADSRWPWWLKIAAAQAEILATPLELAIKLPREGGAAELTELARKLGQTKSDVARVLCYQEGQLMVSALSFSLVREHLGILEVPIGAGTESDFVALNRNWPTDLGADFLHWSMNPQAHAVDLTSLTEAPGALPAQLQTARFHFSDAPLVVSPITLKPRFSPADTRETSAPIKHLPTQVDSRQLSRFAAGWTLAVIKHLAESGAESITLFETTGWRGVLERVEGSALPSEFPSQPGQVFPLYYVIGEVNGFGNGEVITTRSSAPFRVQSLALVKKGRTSLWLANLTAQSQRVSVGGFETVTHRSHMPWDLTQVWMFRPNVLLRQPGEPLPVPVERELEIDLEPFGLHRLELTLRAS